jgi:hypothetical protein
LFVAKSQQDSCADQTRKILALEEKLHWKHQAGSAGGGVVQLLRTWLHCNSPGFETGTFTAHGKLCQSMGGRLPPLIVQYRGLPNQGRQS